MAKTRAQQNRAIRQESLRELLAEQCRVQHIIENIIKMEELDGSVEQDSFTLNKLKIANEQRMKLLNKYLPDLKNVELANDGGGTLTINLVDFSDEEKDKG